MASILKRPLWALALLGLVAGPAMAADLTQLLMSQLGVTQPQAVGGAGSVFRVAQAQMAPTDFQKIQAVVPGMSNYLSVAQTLLPQLGALSGGAAPVAGGVAGLAAAAGGGGGGLGNAAALAGAAGLAGGGTASGLANAAGAATAAQSGGTAGLAGMAAGAALGNSGGGALGNAAALAGATGAGNAGGLGNAAAAAGLAGMAGGGNASALGAAAGLAAGAAQPSPTQALVGQAAQMAGPLGQKMQVVQLLSPVFEKLGMNSNLVAQFVPVIGSYLEQSGGSGTSQLLLHALGM